MKTTKTLPWKRFLEKGHCRGLPELFTGDRLKGDFSLEFGYVGENDPTTA